MTMNLIDKAKGIAYADTVILALGFVLTAVIGLIFAFECNPEEVKGKEARLLFVGLLIRFLIGSLLQLSAIIFLLEGVLLRNHKRCSVWIIVNKVFMGLMTISAIVKLFMNPVAVFLELIGIGYKIFCHRIVGAYSLELQNDSVFHP